MPATLIATRDFDRLGTGLYFMMFYVAVSLSQLIVGPLSDRYGRIGFMVLGLTLAAGGLASFTFLPQPWVYGPLAVASLGLGVFSVASMAMLNESVPETLKGTISGSYYLAWGSGYLLGPMAVESIGGGVSSGDGYLALAVAAVVVAAVLALRPRKSRQ